MSMESLLAAAEAGAMIVAANVRTQRRLHTSYDVRQQERGRSAWATPVILSWGAWIDSLWHEYVLLPGDVPPVRLNSAQELAIWERVIRESTAGRSLIAIGAAAELACEAWTRLKEYCVADRSLLDATTDGAAFRQWIDAFTTICGNNHWTSAASVPDLLTCAFAERSLAAPPRLLLVGFDKFTPQQERLFSTLRVAGASCEAEEFDESTEVDSIASLALDDAADEIQSAAEWARARLEANPGASIGVVVPDLRGVRDTVERVFTEVLAPESLIAPSDTCRPFELSLGRPLASYPVVHFALELLRWAGGAMPSNNARALIRSPYMRAGMSEASRRAMLDVEMGKKCAAEITTAEARRLAAARHGDGTAKAYQCPMLVDVLREIGRRVERCPKLPSAWSRHCADLLEAVGWAGERGLSSAEYQACEAWRDVLSEFGTLDAAVPPLSYRDAIDWLARLAGKRIFQPENVGAPLQVLGALEASGSRFDHLWIVGTDDERWPGNPKPNPLLPVALQKRYGMPHASPADDLEFAKRVTKRLCHSAREVIFSYPKMDGERGLQRSPLIADVPESTRDQVLPQPPVSWIAQIQASADELDAIAEDKQLELRDDNIRGGTQVFKLQAACPFRAFAELRLGAREVESPVQGLSAAERGNLVHMVLQIFWQRLDGSAELQKLSPEEQRELVMSCVDEALAKERLGARDDWFAKFALLERERLTNIVNAWLDLERQRAPFKVTEREEIKRVEMGGIAVEVRVDRVDQLASGGRVILDYKTGAPKGNLEEAWDAVRPDEPQLPLYAVASNDGLAALAFAYVRPGEMRFRGQADADNILPGVKALREEQLGDKVAQWRQVLEQLGESFRCGEATVDPKDPDVTCQYCPLPPLCRIYESDLAEELLAADGEGEDR